MELPATGWIAIVTTFVTIVLAILNKCWDPIAAHVGYPYGVKRCLEELRGKVQQLSDMQKDLLHVDHFPSSTERRGWLGRVEALLKKEKEMKDRLARCGLVNYLEKCNIGREAELELKKASDLVTQGNRLVPKVKTSLTRGVDTSVPEVEESPHHVQLEEQPVPNPLPGMHNPYDKVLDLPGMKNPYDKVLEFFKDNHAKSVIMGVWGMGGVGKTTLINLVHDSRPVEYNDYFLEVVLVQAGKGCAEVADLQKAIAIRMELHQIDNEISQAEIIRRHLQNKNFLLLVDDLWKDLDLKAVGIPPLDVQPHRRKVVFTTRSMDVCTNMRCGPKNTIQMIQMKCLNEKDAWNLFAKQVGNTIIDHGDIHELAKEIVEECRGLPMALCTVGKFMSPKVDPSEWRIASDLLKKSKLHEITDSHEDLFKRLKESYDNLRDDMKKRFLVCSLWPENGNISMKILTRWWTGLGLLDGYNASDTGYALIKDLVRLSLLEKGDIGLDSTENSHVKMHNMIRMMAIGIVNEHGNKNKWLPNSLYRSALREEMWCTVEKAWVSQEDTSRWHQWSSKAHFPELKMLVAQHLFPLQLIHFFQNITFLDLEGIRRGGFPLEICKLTNLQHLNLSATRIDVLPLDLNKLIYLKFLYIRYNMHLRTIPGGLILALKSLQGLDLFSTGASFLNVLKELASFAEDLHMLGFTVRTTEEITQLGQLKRVCTQALCMHHFEDDKHPATINLQLLSNLTELRELAIVTSSHIESLVADGRPNLLSCLEIFELNNLLKLEKVTWKNAGMDIRVVSIYKCDKLKDVTWVHHLKLLEQLTLAHCKEMEILIETGESQQGVGMNQTATISFPKLKKLKLEELPKLSMISQKACKFEELSYICVTQCNQLRGIQHQSYVQSMIKINCSEDWWNRITLGRFIPYFARTFSS